MIGLDTNILIRYVTWDDPVHSRKAAEVIERLLTPENPGFISLVALVETVWVLGRRYGLSAQEIAGIVERLLQVETFVVQNEREVFQAMVALRAGYTGFSDALIGALGSWAGCSSTYTFDKKAARLDWFEIL